jgi:dTDP-4-dehydrorhamnose reductase
MRVPSDQLGNASYAGDLAEGVAALVEGGWGGVWHLAGPEPGLARVDFARRIARHYGLDESLVEPVSTAELGQPARRPLHGGLRIDKAREALGFSPRAWVPCAGV